MYRSEFESPTPHLFILKSEFLVIKQLNKKLIFILLFLAKAMVCIGKDVLKNMVLKEKLENAIKYSSICIESCAVNT